MFSIVEDSISVRRQNNPDLLHQVKALHQSPEIELKNIHIIWPKGSDLSPITAKSRPEWTGKRARNAQKTTTATS